MPEQQWNFKEALMRAAGDKKATLMVLLTLESDLDRLYASVEQTLALTNDKNTTWHDIEVQFSEMKSIVAQMKILGAIPQIMLN